jgi:hypothetical protein
LAQQNSRLVQTLCLLGCAGARHTTSEYNRM